MPAPAETVPPQFPGEPPAYYPVSAPPAIVAPNFGDNPIDRFVTERCETGAGKRMLAGELYAGFLEWGSSTGQEPISQRAFGMRLTALGLRRKRRGHGKHWWEGIRVAG